MLAIPHLSHIMMGLTVVGWLVPVFWVVVVGKAETRNKCRIDNTSGKGENGERWLLCSYTVRAKKKKKNFILFSLLGEILAGILRVCIVRL